MELSNNSHSTPTQLYVCDVAQLKILGFLIISLAVFLLLNKITNDLPAQCEDPHVFQLVCCGHYPQRTTESDI